MSRISSELPRVRLGGSLTSALLGRYVVCGHISPEKLRSMGLSSTVGVVREADFFSNRDKICRGCGACVIPSC